MHVGVGMKAEVECMTADQKRCGAVKDEDAYSSLKSLSVGTVSLPKLRTVEQTVIGEDTRSSFSLPLASATAPTLVGLSYSWTLQK